MTDLQAIQAWLQTSYSVQVPPDWLAACMEWIQQENGGQSVAAPQLRTLVFEQWLMADLRELGTACLPHDLANTACTQLPGSFALQVESMVNVGIPLYGQLQKVKGTLNENSEVSADTPLQPAWEPKPSRMMLLKMTDGQIDITGIEYRPIQALTHNLQPGFKVVVHGQVMCRRGVLMLTADNLQVLGGEVDSLIETNTPVAVLERAMEASTLNIGKAEKKQFSGKFISRKDSKLCASVHTQNTNRGSKLQVSSQQQGSGNTWGRRSNGQLPSVKKEPATAIPDDWEEDLDYGSILDEPMEEEILQRSVPASSLTSQDVKPVLSTRNLSSHSSHQASMSNLVNNSRQPGNSHSSSGRNKTDCFGSKKVMVKQSYSQQNAFPQKSSVPRNTAAQQPSLKSDSGFDDPGWDDDDDFAFEADELMSPVIPVQGQAQSGRSHLKNTGAMSTTPSNNHAARNSNLNPLAPRSASCLTTRSTLENQRVNEQHMFTSAAVTSAKRRSLQETQNTVNTSSLNIPRANSFSSLSNTAAGKLDGKLSKPKLNTLFQGSSGLNTPDSASTSVPPPAKQRKLTSMLSSVYREIRTSQDSPRQQKLEFESLAFTQNLSPGSRDPEMISDTASEILTHCNPQCPPQVEGTVSQNGLSISNGGTSRGLPEDHVPNRMETTQKPVAHVAANVQNVGEKESSDLSNLVQTCKGTSSGQRLMGDNLMNVKQVTEPDEEIQSLQDAQQWLATHTQGEAVFTAKGYITTLTDRLRSDKGIWSLACRITDNTATMEVAIDDSVLRKLIGFSAKDSFTLRQQARKDPEIKKHMEQGLTKCQTALVEFSGLMDVRVKAGGEKPCMISMVLLEKKQRPIKSCS